MKRWLLQCAVAMAIALNALVPVRSDDPVSSSVRYTGEIVRILDRRCLACHGNDRIANPLTTYRQVRDWGRAIREEIVEQRMPPWSAARGYQRFTHELALTSRETATLLSWLDGGMPRGDDRDLPTPPPRDPEEQPDLRLAIPAQRVPPLEEHVVRRVVVETNLDTDRLIERVTLAPGRRSLLRGALVFVSDGETREQWVGAWLPWHTEIAPPQAQAFRLPARARLTVELHYRGDEGEATDQPSIDLFFADTSTPREPLDEVAIGSTPVTLRTASSVWALVPAADASTKSLELRARRADGTVDVLLWIPDYRHDWPQVFVLQTPASLPRGTVVSLTTEPAAATTSARLSVMADRRRR